MRITKFCCGLELSNAVKYLGTFGVVMSIIGEIATVLFGFSFLLGPSLLNLSQIILGVIYGGAALLIPALIGWLSFSYILLKRNSNNDIEGVKKLIKTGSYIIGYLQAVLFTIALITGIVFVTSDIRLWTAGCVLIPVGGIFIVFASLLLHGIKTNSPQEIRTWIVFQFFIFCTLVLLFVCLYGLSYLETTQLIVLTIGLCLYLIYVTAMVIVHYNIVLENDTNIETELNDITNTMESESPLQQLAALFPNLERSLLSDMLSSNQDNLEKTVDDLLCQKLGF